MVSSINKVFLTVLPISIHYTGGCTTKQLDEGYAHIILLQHAYNTQKTYICSKTALYKSQLNEDSTLKMAISNYYTHMQYTSRGIRITNHAKVCHGRYNSVSYVQLNDQQFTLQLFAAKGKRICSSVAAPHSEENQKSAVHTMYKVYPFTILLPSPPLLVLSSCSYSQQHEHSTPRMLVCCVHYTTRG